MKSNTATYTDNTNSKTKKDYSFFVNAAKYGVVAGGLTALYFFALQFGGMEDAIGIKYLGYGILGILLSIGLVDYDRYLKTGATFKNGMMYAAQITLFAGATLVAINTITFVLGTDLGFSKYGVESATFPESLMLSGAIFLEIMVAGLIFTFIILQYLKSRRDYKS